MNKSENKFFERYILLRDEIDNKSMKIETEHTKQMECKKGCDMCCMDYKILPIEYHFIINDLKIKKIVPEISALTKEEGGCIFLINHACTIYNQRPVICRTHGLPLLFMNGNSEWELSACDLNFKNYNFEDFTLDNTFPQDKYNSKLFMLNKEFISDFQEKKYGEFELISLKNIVEQLI
ncbi:MAG: hypothetical protein GQ525_01850 [Draconibacterium sp.]|nr:hypothetical protein [Draconibacterium sp.]